jgi:alpha-tubulin suppressor-like RCC1 family protein
MQHRPARALLFFLLGFLVFFGGTGLAHAQSAPVITVAPADTAGTWGKSGILSVTATNASAYQWYRGESGDTSAPVAGATGPLLVTQALSSTSRFWVRVTNASLSTDSPSATVTVVAPPQPLALAAMGNNSSGQLGDGSTTSRAAPVKISTGIAAAAAGSSHSLFLKADGSLWAMGSNAYGQLGDGTTTWRTAPVQISTGVASVSAGGSCTLFVKTDGSLWAMGSNSSGQLGDGSFTSRSSPVQITTGVSSVSAGGSHSLFIKTDGSLWAMGSNSSGQLGVGSFTTRTSPVQITTGVVSVSAGSSHSLFIKTDGSLWAMGSNSSGRLGDGTTTNRTAPVQITTNVASVSAGGNHTLFIKADGSLWAMGSNSSGQLGDGSYTSRSAPVQITTGVASVSAGGNHTLFIKTDGSLWAMGSNSSGQFGDGSTTSRFSPVLISTDVSSSSAGGSHSLCLGQIHTVTFDLGSYATRSGGGALSQTVFHGGAAAQPTLNVSSGWVFTGWDLPFTSVTADLVVTAQYVAATPPAFSKAPDSTQVPWQNSAALAVVATANGPLAYQWYCGESGDTSAPVAGATGPLLVTQALSSSSRFWVRVTNAGLYTDSPSAVVTISVPRPLALAAMGDNSYGQLGTGSTSPLSTPAQISPDVVSVSTRAYHTLFIKSDGSLWAMGLNGYGQLGTGNSSDSYAPVQVATDVASVSVGNFHSLFIKTDGSLWAMGSNESGQLGNGTGIRSDSPVQIATDVASVAAGAYHTFFVKTDGALWGMGLNFQAQLGDGSTTNRYTPVQIASGVASASNCSFIKTDGSLWATNTGSPSVKTPVQVATGVAFASNGGSHTVFIKPDGSLWAMGYNYYGQLGDGSSTSPSSPVQIATGVATASAGENHSLFVKSDGALWAMGRNGSSQLGDGSTTDRSSPVQIATGVASVSAGANHSFFLGQTHTITFALGAHATRTGGGGLTQTILHGGAATAPTLNVASGWVFNGWDLSFASVTGDLVVTAQYLATVTFPDWADDHGLTSAGAAPSADPDGDGVPNLLEYFFGTSPSLSGSVAAPSLASGSLSGQPALLLTHRRLKSSVATFVYQTTSNLADPASWTSVTPVSTVVDSDVDHDGLVELVTVSIPVPPSAPGFFVRIHVSP